MSYAPHELSREEVAGPGSVPLSVVMPAYNEEPLLKATVEPWLQSLRELEIGFEMLILDDGSTDQTLCLLGELAAEFPEIVVHSHPNSGHGPTILRGFREARGDWVLQIDSDGEVFPSDFQRFWRMRDDFDFLLGFREGRNLGLARNWLSRVARAWSGLCFGTHFRDVNCPFRLMRKSFLGSYVPLIPESAFAPNLLLTGFAGRDGWRCLEIPVQWSPRRSGEGLRIDRELIRDSFRSALLLFEMSRSDRRSR